ncbi:MAG: TolC family protein [Myxococcales bacterium]|nr:TolC family protein [Myxococcales bacterium]
MIAGVTVPLPVFGPGPAARRSARAAAAATRALALVGRLELREQIEVAWLDLARAQELAALADDAIARARELEQVAQARLDAGDTAAVDVQAALAARLRAEVDGAAVAADVVVAGATLATLVGWDADDGLVAEGGLPAPTLPPTVAALRAQLGQHPEARAAAAARDATAASAALIARERWPALAVDLEVDALDRRGDPDDVRASLVVEVPLFGRAGARARAARAEVAVAVAELSARTQALTGELIAAQRRARATAARAQRFELEVLPAQELATAQALAAYRAGATDLIAALVAGRELLAVRAEVTEARYQAAVAQAALARALGGGP